MQDLQIGVGTKYIVYLLYDIILPYYRTGQKRQGEKVSLFSFVHLQGLVSTHNVDGARVSNSLVVQTIAVSIGLVISSVCTIFSISSDINVMDQLSYLA